jgi:hypothetical protein
MVRIGPTAVKWPASGCGAGHGALHGVACRSRRINLNGATLPYCGTALLHSGRLFPRQERLPAWWLWSWDLAKWVPSGVREVRFALLRPVRGCKLVGIVGVVVVAAVPW